MKKRFFSIMSLIIFIFFLLGLSSCKQNEQEKSENVFLKESVDLLEERGWVKTENKHSMAEETEYLLNYCHIFDETFEIEELKDSILLIAPERLQTKENFSYDISFTVFASNEDAQKYMKFQQNRNNRGIHLSIVDNVIIETNSDEAISLLNIEFVIV